MRAKNSKVGRKVWIALPTFHCYNETKHAELVVEFEFQRHYDKVAFKSPVSLSLSVSVLLSLIVHTSCTQRQSLSQLL